MNNSWIGIKIRKGEKTGKIIRDNNGIFRILTIKFDDSTTEDIWMNNVGPDPKYIHDYEWFCENQNSSINNTWVRF